MGRIGARRGAGVHHLRSASLTTREIDLDTTGEPLTNLTPELVSFCSERGDGLVNCFCPHATAALLLMELGAGSDLDLISWLESNLPLDTHFHHRHGSPGHGADHLLPALFGASVTVPVRAGRPLLGTWQSLALLDTNRDNNRRRVLFTFVPG
jgi:secondary thiamine-phosphate synthase enzyme